MSLVAAHSELSNILLNDAGLLAWANEHFNKGIEGINGNVAIEDIDVRSMPVLGFELVDGTSTPEVGNESQLSEPGFELFFGWQESDPQKAFFQRLELVDLMIEALMKNSTLNGAVSGAWVSKWIPDRNSNPMGRFMNFNIDMYYEALNDD